MRTFPKVLLVAALSATILISGCKKAQEIAHHATSSEPDYTTQLQAVITPGLLDKLKYPDFTDIQPQVAGFYDMHQFDLMWVSGGKPTSQARAMMEAFVNANERGLRPEDYDAARLQDLGTGLKNPERAAAFDVAMTIDTMRFLSDLHQGRTNPAHFVFGVKGYNEKKLNSMQTMDQQIVQASNVDAVLDSLEPQAEQYKELKTALLQYLKLAAQDHIEQLPAIDNKTPNRTLAGYAYMQPLAQRLVLVGDLDANSAGDNAAITDALKHFQTRHGITPDGKLGHTVVEALNTPITSRVNTIMDTMERWRWLDDSYQNAAIMVNLPEFQLRAFEGTTAADHHEVFRMNVVDGKSDDPTHHTPIIADQMKYLVFRPFWNVPPSIAKKEIIPHIQANAGYLGAKNYETVDLKGQPASADINRIAQGTVMVRQKSGTSNSLGLVKFMFPNAFNVYLHDTNEKALFARNRRDYSHGCVRVQDPPKLADWVLRDNPKWDEQAIADAMNTGTDNKSVSLPHPIPVVVFYATAWVENGEVHFFQDMYGYDKDLENTLDHGRPYPVKPMKQVVEADA